MSLGSDRPTVFPEREFAFGPAEFAEIASRLEIEAGIALNEAKAPLVYSRLVKRLRALGLSSFRQYCDLLDGDDRAECTQMVSALTTNVTRFFREAHHFDHLKQKVLPGLMQSARRGGRIRIWSAGCSSGEEAYSIALTVLSVLPEAHRLDVKILATDIDPDMLHRARAGRFDAAAVEQIPLIQRRRYWTEEPSGEGWHAGEELRALTAFRTLNLLDPWPMKGPFDAVFCRNVMIYFTETARDGLWPRLAGMIEPGGYLYLGHSERATDGGKFFSVAGTTTYARAAHSSLRPEGREQDA